MRGTLLELSSVDSSTSRPPGATLLLGMHVTVVCEGRVQARAAELTRDRQQPLSVCFLSQVLLSQECRLHTSRCHRGITFSLHS